LEERLQSVRKHMALAQASVVEPPRRSLQPHDWAGRLSGAVEFLDMAGSFSVTSSYDPGHIHGLHRFSDLRSVNGNAFSVVCRDPELSYADLQGAVFLDTETTGLGMGTGTYVFLIGAGYMEGDRFVVKQFFLDTPGDERLLLDALGSFLSRFPVLITFNGKAFDWPLLESRFRLHRRRAPFDDPPHLDLLHPARRLWKRRLESCALTSLEAQILGIRRTLEDVPGWEIPFRYFRYQRSGDGSQLEGVFYHNLVDILSLASLALHIDRIVADPNCGLVEHGSDYFCIGKVYEVSGDGDMAVYCYEEALRRGVLPELRPECYLRLGRLHKRVRRWDAAIQCWETLLDDGGRAGLVARVELAKFYEHVERDYVTAIDHVQHALVLAELFDSPWPDANQRDLEHRLSRLLNRSIRARQWEATYG
jgi:uncharacterized protein YprB with RNaseH-like and TPR domain